jgi:SAM-dependent methyltransferase
MFPGWGPLLERYPRAQRWIPRLDKLVRDRPALADFVVSVWRPRPQSSWPTDEYRVRRNNPVYQRLVRVESRFWETAAFDKFFGDTNDATARSRNREYTGDPERTWLADLAARGPFGNVAVLGCDDEGCEGEWLRAGGSQRLDVYELSPGVIGKTRARLGALADRVRFVEADLNFIELPEAAYDCIWSSGVLHFVTNLEHLFSQVARALRPGGLFAFRTYVGEARLQYDPERLAKVNALLQTIPARYRRSDTIEAPNPAWSMTPFQAVRPRDILPLAHARFDVVYEATAARLFPLPFVIDVPTIAKEDPALFERLIRAEEEAKADPVMQPCSVYAVFRKRG